MKILSVQPDTYGSLLVPLINKIFQNDSKLLIARQFHSYVLSLSKTLECLKKEIRAKEIASLTWASYSRIHDKICAGRYSISSILTHAVKGKLKKVQRPCIFFNLFDDTTRMYSKVLDMTIKDTFSKEVGDISFALKPVVLW